MNNLAQDQALEAQVRRAVEEHAGQADIAHDMDHISCVVGLAKRIGAAERANMRVVVTAGYLHDLTVNGTKFAVSQEQRATAAITLLDELAAGFSDAEREAVRHAVHAASYSAMLRGVKPMTLEARVVRDADFLEAMGARGVARTFATCGWYRSGSLGRVEWDIEHPPRLPMHTANPDPSPIYHFFSKLLWLQDYLLTATARVMAAERHRFLIRFLQQYAVESEEAQS